MPTKRGGRGKARKKAEEEPAPSRKGTIAISAVIIVVIVVVALLLQSGILGSPGAGNGDVDAASQVFNSFFESVNSHDAETALSLTTMKFVQENVTNEVIINFFKDTFSNQSLVFTKSGTQYFSEEQMSPSQKSYSLGVIENITDPNSPLHIDQVVTGYVLLTGNMVMSGIESPPQIDQMVIAKIGTGWYIVLR